MLLPPRAQRLSIFVVTALLVACGTKATRQPSPASPVPQGTGSSSAVQVSVSPSSAPQTILTVQRQVITEDPWGIPTGDGYVSGDAWDSNPPRTLPPGSCYGTGFGSGNRVTVRDQSGAVVGTAPFDDLGTPAQISTSEYEMLFEQFHGTSVFGDSSGDIWVCVWTVQVPIGDAASYQVNINASEGYGADESVMGWTNPWDLGSPCNWAYLPGPSCYAGFQVELTREDLDQAGWLVQVCDEPAGAPADFMCVRTGGE